MKTRLYTPADYTTVGPWFTAHKTQPVPETILPKCGIVVEEEGLLLAAGWLYQDNSVGVAWLAWLVSNPDIPRSCVETALGRLLRASESVAKDLGYGVLFTMTNRPSLGRWLQRQGFEANHQGAVQYFKPLS
jgi:N-acetylglutamate synthase-like GNAT family acetyltransferase